MRKNPLWDRNKPSDGGRWAALAVAVLLAVHVGLALHDAIGDFPVIDEIGHVASGACHWKTGTYAAYRVNPPLARMVAALAILPARLETDFHRLDPSPGLRPEWDLGQDFLAANPDRFLLLVRLARLPGLAWSALGALIIYAWGRDLYGRLGGLIGLAVWCFQPVILAFAHVVTPDVPAAVAGVSASYAFWRFLRLGGWSRAVLAGLLLGLAELTKLTMVVFYVVWPLLWWLRERRQAATGRVARAAQLMAILAITVPVLNVGYAFQGTGRRLGDYAFVSRMFSGDRPESHWDQAGNRFRGTWLGALPVPLPEDYLRGADAQRIDFESLMPSYLGGVWRDGGWYYYYLYAWAVKTPLGFLALFAWAVARPRPIPRAGAQSAPDDEWHLWLPALVLLGLVSSQTGFNHHVRYILPALPFLAILTGRLALRITPGSRGRVLPLTAMLAWGVASTLSVHPHELSYFNELAGGPLRGHDHLVDSNIDWGQDLLYLKQWLDGHPEAKPLHLAYFNSADPSLLGIDYRLPAPDPGRLDRALRAHAQAFGPQPGYYAVSVHLLRGATFWIPDGQGGRSNISRHGEFDYFRRFRPIARAGYSIYIYKIETDEANRVRSQLGLPPVGPSTHVPAPEATNPPEENPDVPAPAHRDRASL
jgi:Dolichyl-phosphate-mannose-protein mannosyltransferase